MNKFVFSLILFLLVGNVAAQNLVSKPSFVTNPMDSLSQKSFYESLDSLFASIARSEINPEYISDEYAALTTSQIRKLARYEQNYQAKRDSTQPELPYKQFTNIYPISKKEYAVSIAYISERTAPILVYDILLIATQESEKFTFSIPLRYLTRHWKTKKIGNTTYHYRSKLDEKRAKIFDKKHLSIAEKLNVKPEGFDFYMTDNYQEILALLGFSYSAFENGSHRDGYGVVDKTIFAVGGDEDFSHDVFHYYSGQIHKRKNRNWVTEEGVAYLWGNAYYTDKEGLSISQDTLVRELQNYIKTHPDSSLYSLFKNNIKIFDHIAPEVSVRSTISGILVKEVEDKKGIKGVLELVNAGAKDRLESYMKAIEKLLGINEENFDKQVKQLLEKY